MNSNTPFTVPAFKIEVDGREISAQTMSAVQSVRFEEDINTASMFVINIFTSDIEKGTWRFLDLEEFSLGREVKLYMGMDSIVEMMVGEITSIEPSFGEDFSFVEIRGYDRLHRLRFGRKTRTYSNMKDSDIASSIASEWGLSSKVIDSTTLHPYLFQKNQSDLEFVLDRAKRIRYEVFVNDKTLYFRPSKENDAKSLILEYRVDFDELNLKLSARYGGSEIKVQGWDFTKKKMIFASARKGDEISKMSAEELGTDMTESAFGSSSSVVVDENMLDTSEAEKVANARYNAHLVESVKGDGNCMGIPELRAGNTVEINGIGRFSGIYYVVSTSHVIDNMGYNTSFKVRRAGV